MHKGKALPHRNLAKQHWQCSTATSQRQPQRHTLPSVTVPILQLDGACLVAYDMRLERLLYASRRATCSTAG